MRDVQKKSWYHQIPVGASEQDNTVFVTHRTGNKWVFKRLPLYRKRALPLLADNVTTVLAFAHFDRKKSGLLLYMDDSVYYVVHPLGKATSN